jgi:antitoxin VapB
LKPPWLGCLPAYLPNTLASEKKDAEKFRSATRIHSSDLAEVYILDIYLFERFAMNRFAKLFRNGSSQAVRLPREFRFKGDKVRIRRVGKSVVLEPLVDDPEAWLAELKNIPSDPDFMRERDQPKTPKREIFK